MKAKKALPYLAVALGVALPLGIAPAKPASKAPKGSIPDSAVSAEESAKGMDGDVTVKVTADEHYIYSVEVTKQNETPGIGTIAVDELPSAMLASQTVNVDTVSGATITSAAIKTAAAAALEKAGVTNAAFTAEPEGTVTRAADQDVAADIVVVGAGGAGMTAAITAADIGCSVVLLESQSMAGGNSVRATGGMNAAKTAWQDKNEFAEGDGVENTLKKAASDDFKDNEAVQALAATVQQQYADYQKDPQGYFDSVELMQLDTIIGGKGLNNPDLVKALVEGTEPAINWLNSIGATLHDVGAFGGASVKRIHRPVDEEGKTIAVGAYVVPVLEEAIEARPGIRTFYSTTADKILMKNGKAVGVHAVGPTGENIRVRAKSVVMATGGFGANHEMVEHYKPDLKGFMSTNADGAQGQGIQMGEDAGAATVDMEQIQIHPTVEYSSAHLITEGLRGDGAILVNKNGERFFDEVGTRDAVSAAEIAQPDGYAWLIIDQQMVDASKVIQGYITAGYTKQGDDYASLAKELGVDAATFEQTMNTWNDCVAAKKDEAFGRTSFADTLSHAPYYAIQVTPGIHHTMGGLAIDINTRVLDKEGNAIPSLFAAGEVTGGVHGANRLGGNAVADFIVYGRKAGIAAASNAGIAADEAAMNEALEKSAGEEK